MVELTDGVRPAAVAGAFYPADPVSLQDMINTQLDYARELLESQAGKALQLPQGAPKAIIVPHAGYVYSGTTAALAYALLTRGRGRIRRAVIIGPTHRVPVRGVAMCTAGAFETPLGTVKIDQDYERATLGDPAAPALIVNDPTHMQEHAVEVQVPFLLTVLGPDITIVPLNAGDATPQEVGAVLRALWGGPETVIVISSDLSHYHPEPTGRRLDDQTIAAIASLQLPITPDRACGAFPVNGLLDVCSRGVDGGRSDARSSLDLRFLGCSTSGDDGKVALADAGAVHSGGTGAPAHRQPVPNPTERVVGYASFAMWAHSKSIPINDQLPGAAGVRDAGDHGKMLLDLARASLEAHLHTGDGHGGTDAAKRMRRIIDGTPWLQRRGASFITLTEDGELRGCIGSLQAYRSLGEDVADHAVDAAMHDPRFAPVSAREYPRLAIEVSVLSAPKPLPVTGRADLERRLRRGMDGLIIDDGRGRSATFLPQVWDELPDPNNFITHLLAKAGLPASQDWWDNAIRCSTYTVSAYKEPQAKRGVR